MPYSEDDRPWRRRNARRFDDDDDDDAPPRALRRGRAAPLQSSTLDIDRPETGDRWSTWDQSTASERGPWPYPDWLVTDLAAVDVGRGVLKTGKEADVHLIERGVPGTERSCLLAAKRYRDAHHRQFHRDAGYLEGRRVRRSRETRALARRTSFGRQIHAGQWAAAEFAVLCQLWEAGQTLGVQVVPYPVQVLGTEVLMEFIGDPETGQAAPRLAQLRPDPGRLADLWEQLVTAMSLLARLGLTHGDLSPYNLLVHGDRLILIDLPQVVDVVANSRGPEYLARDARVVHDWFVARGLPDPGYDALVADLLADAGWR